MYVMCVCVYISLYMHTHTHIDTYRSKMWMKE